MFRKYGVNIIKPIDTIYFKKNQLKKSIFDVIYFFDFYS